MDRSSRNHFVVASIVLASVALFTASPAFPGDRELKPVRARALTSDELDGLRHDGRRLFLKSVVFDPSSESPDFTAEDLQKGDAGEYAILQFHAGEVSTKEILQRIGVQFFGYLPDNAFQVRIPRAVRGRVESDPAVRWVGDYLPGYKIHPRLWPGSADPGVDLTIRLFPGASALKIALLLGARHAGAARREVDEDPVAPLVRFSVSNRERERFVRNAARMADVSWIEPWDPLELHNSNSTGPIQGNAAGEPGRTIFGHGITGTGQIAAVADTGADSDMCYFRRLNGVDEVTDATRTVSGEPGPTFPNRKTLGYWVQEGADPYDTNAACDGDPASFHGSHTAGTVLGDSSVHPSSRTDPGLDNGDGMAPNAQLIFQDIGNATGCLDSGNSYRLFQQAMLGGARVHSNSYGGASAGAYSTSDENLDRFLFDHDEMAIVFSAGNSGPKAMSTGSPGNAKNVVTVGALGNGNSLASARFSSRGPTADGRIKPDIMAPGSDIFSALGNETHGDGNCDVQVLSGTSMAAPTVAGGAVLLRQYFEDGFYPTGAANAADRFHPRAPLVKAVLLNGTVPVLTDGAFGDTRYGWGRIFLDNNLFFAGDPRRMRVWTLGNTEGLITGQSHSYRVAVGEGKEFRATLVWFDPEGTPGAATTLVNDLDLTVRTPDGTFVGNSFAANESTTTGSGDQKNTVEQVRFALPRAGVYTVTVTGRNVPGNGRALTNRQGYALAASFASCTGGVSGTPGAIQVSANPAKGVDLTWSPAAGSNLTQIYRANGSAPAEGEYQYVGSASGSSYTDTRAQGGQTYSYRLRGADDCAEGPISVPVTITATGSCDIDPQFSGIATATADGNNCRINLTWPNATPNCVLGQNVRYNIYRSTSPDFVPGETPLASVKGNEYSDTNIASGTTYYYVIRAEDGVSGSTGPHGGNEEGNVMRLYATAFGPPGASGTWRDDAGDSIALLSPETPWRITATDHQAGARSYHSGPDAGVYSGDTCAALTSTEIQIGSGAELVYWARFNLEYQWDGVIVEISTDGGSTWTDLPPTTPAGYPTTLAETLDPPINVCGYPKTHGAFSGPQGNLALTVWTEYKTSLASYAGKNARLRWRLTTDPGLAFQGFYLDSISITNVNLATACNPIAVKPEASFALSPAIPQVGKAARFVDDSSNEPTSWQWSFGDGGTSTERHPLHMFAAAGNFSVSLTVTNAAGSSMASRNVSVVAQGQQPKKRRAAGH